MSWKKRPEEIKKVKKSRKVDLNTGTVIVLVEKGKKKALSQKAERITTQDFGSNLKKRGKNE